MRVSLAAALGIALSLGAPASAHRLNEYLQATMLSVGKDRVDATMRLVPGVAVSSAVIAAIDVNGDGILSETERHAYAERVLQDVSFSIDGRKLTPYIVSFLFPKVEDMTEGVGEIKIEFAATLMPGGRNRKIVFENHHLEPISAYLVNCLLPQDRDIQIVSQWRSGNQAKYELEYARAVAHSNAAGVNQWRDAGGFPSMFRLGMRHIAEGTDHLLFLLTLLLPAPLLVCGTRWAGFDGARHSLVQVLRVVTAFTMGHSLTLAAAALGLIRVPSRPIEILIAVSILVSAIHALRPIFPGHEAGIAASFGLMHGFAFAATLQNLGLGWWDRAVSILGFNLGIETFQLIVVAATMPSLILLSRTRTYSFVRMGGAAFAAVASVGWIAERLLLVHNPFDAVLDSIAHRAVWIAVGLFVIGVAGWGRDKSASGTRPNRNWTSRRVTGMLLKD